MLRKRIFMIIPWIANPHEAAHSRKVCMGRSRMPLSRPVVILTQFAFRRKMLYLCISDKGRGGFGPPFSCK